MSYYQGTANSNNDESTGNLRAILNQMRGWGGGGKGGLILKCIYCTALFFCLNIAFANSNAGALDMPAIKIETPYGKVRGIMLKHCWSPYHGSNAASCTPEDDRCKGRLEMQNCSDVGLGECSWLWKKNGKIVLIKTQDDDLYYGATRYYGH